MTDRSLRDDPVWNEALDWLTRVNAAPDDTALRAELDTWLARREAHAAAFRKAEAVWRLTGEAPLRSRSAPGTAARSGRGRRMLRRAAGCALAASVMLALLPSTRLRLAADFRTGIGEVGAATLEDGSLAHLDAASAIAVDYTGARRAVTLLSGQAFFEVVPNPDRPFTVTAGSVTVTVVGTAFDLRLGDESVTVAVESGMVTAEVRHGDRLETARLTHGDRLTVARSTGATRRDRVAAVEVAAWRDGQLVANGASVADIVEELRRYTPGLILLRDDALAGRRVTGTFDPRDPVSALRAAVAPHAGTVAEPLPYLIVVSAP